MPSQSEVTTLAATLRQHLPRGASRLALTSKRARLLRYKLGLMATIDSPFVRLQPPAPSVGEVVAPPDFVGIGVQKAGTSWWFSSLIKHPEVAHRPTSEVAKERQFFSHFSLEEFGTQDASEYARHFPRQSGKLSGEWTPDYFYYSWVPSLLHEAAPEAKLLLMLRDPVERMISGLAHLSRIDEDHLPRENLLQESFDRGLYARQLEHWLTVFDRSQILVQQYEACTADPDGQMARTIAFLGLDDHNFDLHASSDIVNPTLISKKRISENVRRRYADLYADDLRSLRVLVPELRTDLWSSFDLID